MKGKASKGTMRKCSVLVGMWLMLVSAFATPGSKTTMLEGYRVRVVRGGETVETPGTGGTAGTINNREMTGGDYEEAIPAILLEDGATIRVTSGTAIWAMIVMTNGSATIETASGTSLSFNRSLLLRGGAKMTVKGDSLNAVKVGNSDWAPYYELDGLMIKKGATDITDRIHCSSIARIVSMPKDWVENHVLDESLDTGTVYLLDDVYRGMTAINDCWLGKNIYFRLPDYINGREVTVDHAVTLHLEPFEITVPRITLADHLKDVNAAGTQVSFNLSRYKLLF